MLRPTILLFVAAMSVAGAADYREATTGMRFPERCDSWTRTRVDEADREQIGVSVAYAIKNGSVVTCRIFDGQFGAPSDDPAALKREMEEIAAGVDVVWRRMGARVEVSLPVGPLRNDPKQFIVVHRIYTGATQNISISMLMLRTGRYLSFRFTTPGSDGTAAFHELGRFFAALQSANPKPPNQAPQRNAGSRPSSGDTSASETPSSLGPRG
jgi:hypothetical protein